MKKLLVFLRDYKKESVLAPLFKLLEASFELFVPLVMAKIIDVGIGTGDNSYVLKMCGVLILLAFIGLTCAITAQYFAAKAAVGFATKLRHALFEHIQKLSFDELDRVGTSTLITRMTSDINQVQSGVNMVLRLFLRSPFIVFGAMVMAFTIDVKAALIFVVTIPALSVVVFGIMYVSIPLFKKVQSGLDEVLSLTRENLEGSRVIRAFRKEQEETAQFEQKNGLLTGMQLHVGKISALMNPLTYIIINFAIVALIWQGGLRVNVGAITQGEVVALVNYMSQILVELVKLANLIVTVNKSVACGNRIAQVLDMESSMEDGILEIGENFQEQEISEKKSVVSFEDVSMCYQGSKEDAITHISFTAGAGETIGIIGGTGSGKSTLLNIIGGIDGADSGQICINGEMLEDMNEKTLTQYRRKHLGYVFQMYNLIPNLTALENVELALQICKDPMDAQEVLEEVGLGERLDNFPAQLSGGEQQRVSIARALAKNPKLLLCDEPTGALDYNTGKSILKLLQDTCRNSGMTVILITHNSAIAPMADRVIKIKNGRVDKIIQNPQPVPVETIEW